MKLSFIILPAIFFSAALFALEWMPLEEFNDLTRQGNTLVLSEDFENDIITWKLPSGCRIIHGEGLNGTKALEIERDESNYNNYDIAVASYRLNIEPGVRYHVSCFYRSATIKQRLHMAFSASILLTQDGKYVSMVNPKNMNETTEWKKFSFEFTGASKKIDMDLILRLFYKTSGKIYFDNIRIERVQTDGASSFVLKKPSLLKLNDKGEISLKITTSSCNTDELVVILINEKIKRISQLKNNEVSFLTGNLPEGKYTFQTLLVNFKKKTILAKDSITLFRHKNTSPPDGHIIIDNHNRVLIDGKPFLPVGIYVTRIRTEKNIRQIADGGFNFILNYTTRALNIQKEENNTSRLNLWNPPTYGTEIWEKQYRESLDMLSKYNLKYIATNMRIYSPQDKIPQYLPAIQHPALLAHYIADEPNITARKLLKTTRETISGNDPWHPVIVLTEKVQDYLPFAGCGDILGIDPYPIEKKHLDHNMLMVRTACQEAASIRIPFMMVPQAFNWGAYRKNDAFSTYAYPTEEEIRSMTLLAAIYGCKWFCFYSYTGIMELQEKHDPGSSKEFWPRVTATAKLLRQLEPWLLSLEKAPNVTVENKTSSIVDARAFSSNGKLRILITGCGPGKAKAVITIPKHQNLKSRFGNTKALGGGKYLFNGNNISSDILIE